MRREPETERVRGRREKRTITSPLGRDGNMRKQKHVHAHAWKIAHSAPHDSLLDGSARFQLEHWRFHTFTVAIMEFNEIIVELV